MPSGPSLERTPSGPWPERRRLSGQVAAGRRRRGSRGRSGSGSAGAASAGGASTAATAAAASGPSIVISAEPCETWSPSDTRISLTTPATGAGTSIVALSDSSVTSGSSTATVSPAETRISMIGTSSKSPMSGTSIVRVAVLIPSSASAPRGRCRTARSPRRRPRARWLPRPPARSAPRPQRNGGRPQRTCATLAASRCGRSRRCRARGSGRGTHWRIWSANARM